jgi:hypothetical protein
MVKERTRITNLIKGLLNVLFPEFIQVFSDPRGLTALAVLSSYAISGAIGAMAEEEFVVAIEIKQRVGLYKGNCVSFIM